MGGSQCQDSFPSHLLHIDQGLAIGTTTRLATRKKHVHDTTVPDASHSLQNKVCGCDRACLIETANVDSSRGWNTERFRAEDR